VRQVEKPLLPVLQGQPEALELAALQLGVELTYDLNGLVVVL